MILWNRVCYRTFVIPTSAPALRTCITSSSSHLCLFSRLFSFYFQAFFDGIVFAVSLHGHQPFASISISFSPSFCQSLFCLTCLPILSHSFLYFPVRYYFIPQSFLSSPSPILISILFFFFLPSLCCRLPPIQWHLTFTSKVEELGTSIWLIAGLNPAQADVASSIRCLYLLQIILIS